MFICGNWKASTNIRTQSVTCHKTCRICGVMQNRSSIIDLNLVWPCTNFSTLEYFESPRSICTVPLRKSKLFISRSCPILVLTTVPGRPRHTGAKNNVKGYAWPIDFLYTFLNVLMGLWSKFASVLKPRVTSNARYGFSIISFLNHRTFLIFYVAMV